MYRYGSVRSYLRRRNTHRNRVILQKKKGLAGTMEAVVLNCILFHRNNKLFNNRPVFNFQ